MPLASMKDLLADARQGGYAICYCESWNLESFQATLEAAEELSVPTILGFNGGFLTHSSRQAPEKLVYYGGLVDAIRKSPVPAAFLLNETGDLAQIVEGFELGFNAVMVERNGQGLNQYSELIREVVSLARKYGASVEAETETLPCGLEGQTAAPQLTDPYLACDFVQKTGVDALSVSVGNVHILTRGKSAIDLKALDLIRSRVEIPLVIHGGTSFPVGCAAEAIRLGVAKFNFGTVLKQVYLATLEAKLASYQHPMNPHPFLGMGSQEDVLVASRKAVKDKVRELILTYGFGAKKEFAGRA